MGIGRGVGKTRAQEAAAAAISSPLLDFPIEKARGVVFNVVGGQDMTLQEINAAAEVIYEAVDPNANIIFGALVDESITSGEIAITVIATGFPSGGAEGKEYGSGAATIGDVDRDSIKDMPIGQVKKSFGNDDIKSTKSRPSSKQAESEDDELVNFLSKLRKRK
jgi:cell division protein FtsZ